MDMGAGTPEQFVSISRMNNAGLPGQGKSLATASCRRSLEFEEASAHMHRPFGSCGGWGRQEVASGPLESGFAYGRGEWPPGER